MRHVFKTVFFLTAFTGVSFFTIGNAHATCTWTAGGDCVVGGSGSSGSFSSGGTVGGSAKSIFSGRGKIGSLPAVALTPPGAFTAAELQTQVDGVMQGISNVGDQATQMAAYQQLAGMSAEEIMAYSGPIFENVGGQTMFMGQPLQQYVANYIPDPNTALQSFAIDPTTGLPAGLNVDPSTWEIPQGVTFDPDLGVYMAPAGMLFDPTSGELISAEDAAAAGLTVIGAGATIGAAGTAIGATGILP